MTYENSHSGGQASEHARGSISQLTFLGTCWSEHCTICESKVLKNLYIIT